MTHPEFVAGTQRLNFVRTHLGVDGVLRDPDAGSLLRDGIAGAA